MDRILVLFLVSKSHWNGFKFKTLYNVVMLTSQKLIWLSLFEVLIFVRLRFIYDGINDIREGPSNLLVIIHLIMAFLLESHLCILHGQYSIKVS